MLRSATLAALFVCLLTGIGRAEEERPPLPREAPPIGELRLSVEHVVGELVVRQYVLPALSHCSYLLGAKGAAIVVDPILDVGVYVEDARAKGWTIEAVVLTHVPFDVLAGHTALARRCEAEVLVAKRADVAFPHRDVTDGERYDLGGIPLEFWATPGSSPEALSVLVHAPATTAKPAYVLTGGALLLGGMGRPDLHAPMSAPSAMASRAFDTVERLKLLDDETRLLPGYTNGSRIAVRAVDGSMSTIGHEREHSVFLTARSRAVFTARLLGAVPGKPAYFDAVHAANAAGTPAPDVAEPLPVRSLEGWAERRADGMHEVVLDVRPASAYAAGHLRGALNLSLGGRVETAFGAFVLQRVDPVYVVGSEAEAAEAVRRLARIGIDRRWIRARVVPDVEAWEKAGLSVRTCELWSPEELQRRRAAWIEPVIVDVRSPAEVRTRRIEDTLPLPLPAWATWIQRFGPRQPLCFVCETGYRSMLAVGFAELSGLESRGSLVGGIEAWAKAGLPLVGAQDVRLPSR